LKTLDTARDKGVKMPNPEMDPLEQAENDLNPMPIRPEQSGGRDYFEEAERDVESHEKPNPLDEAEDDLGPQSAQ